jgi:hypothetical protein
MVDRRCDARSGGLSDEYQTDAPRAMVARTFVTASSPARRRSVRARRRARPARQGRRISGSPTQIRGSGSSPGGVGADLHECADRGNVDRIARAVLLTDCKRQAVCHSVRVRRAGLPANALQTQGPQTRPRGHPIRAGGRVTRTSARPASRRRGLRPRSTPCLHATPLSGPRQWCTLSRCEHAEEFSVVGLPALVVGIRPIGVKR